MATCQICGGKAKNEKTFTGKRHLESKGHLKALGKTKSDVITSPSISTDMNKRMIRLEKQNQDILTRLTELERIIKVSSGSQTTSKDRSVVRSYLLSKIPKGKSVNVDNLSKATKKYDWKIVESVVSDLVDEEFFDITEGKSDKKILGRFGMIIRR